MSAPIQIPPSVLVPSSTPDAAVISKKVESGYKSMGKKKLSKGDMTGSPILPLLGKLHDHIDK
jgi:hypothetical protein